MAPLSRRRAAVGATFFANGALFATWVTRIPSVKDQVTLSDARMGIALLTFGLGSIASLPIASLASARRGSGPTVRAAAIMACTVLPVAGSAHSLPVLCCTLACFGAALGGMDISMNAQAASLERDMGRSIMSSLHGLYSLGALAGAAAGALFAGRQWSPSSHFAVVGVLLAAATLAATRRAAPETLPTATDPVFAWPSRAVARIGLIAACGFVVEGGIADWGPLYLRDVVGAGAGFAAAGYAAFSVAMTVGRFGADRFIDRWGGPALTRAGSLVAGAALAAALCSNNRYMTLSAFVLAGLGLCTVFPLVFSTAGALRAAGEGHAIAATATMGYGAGLLSPPLIGFAAGATSLRTALGLLVAGCATIALTARAIRT